MKKQACLACAVTLAWAGLSTGVAQTAPGGSAPAFSLAGLDGAVHSLTAYSGKWVVLEWTNYDCPFVRKHYDSGNMQALQKEYTGKGVVWLTVCSSAAGKQGHNSPRRWQELLSAAKSSPSGFLVDADGQLGRLYGAKATPHLFVIDPKGALVYRGAIDDKPSTDKGDIPRATNYVRKVLDAGLSGEAVTPFETAAYGCGVKY
ncbi:MAG: thioredoxin family protein [Lentisphaeria bacterium]|nr:thioredoxin family protein [Lentisphaeria bacterium]